VSTGVHSSHSKKGLWRHRFLIGNTSQTVMSRDPESAAAEEPWGSALCICGLTRASRPTSIPSSRWFIGLRSIAKGVRDGLELAGK